MINADDDEEGITGDIRRNVTASSCPPSFEENNGRQREGFGIDGDNDDGDDEEGIKGEISQEDTASSSPPPSEQSTDHQREDSGGDIGNDGDIKKDIIFSTRTQRCPDGGAANSEIARHDCPTGVPCTLSPALPSGQQQQHKPRLNGEHSLVEGDDEGKKGDVRQNDAASSSSPSSAENNDHQREDFGGDGDDDSDIKGDIIFANRTQRCHDGGAANVEIARHDCAAGASRAPSPPLPSEQQQELKPRSNGEHSLVLSPERMSDGDGPYYNEDNRRSREVPLLSLSLPPPPDDDPLPGAYRVEGRVAGFQLTSRNVSNVSIPENSIIDAESGGRGGDDHAGIGHGATHYYGPAAVAPDFGIPIAAEISPPDDDDASKEGTLIHTAVIQRDCVCIFRGRECHISKVVLCFSVAAAIIAAAVVAALAAAGAFAGGDNGDGSSNNEHTTIEDNTTTTTTTTFATTTTTASTTTTTTTNVPLEETARLMSVRDVLSSMVSDPAVLTNTSSPQYQAMEWLSNEDPLQVSLDEPDHILQRYVVATFYFSTGGPDEWMVDYGFLGPDHECQWQISSTNLGTLGVSCDDADEKVTGIALFSNNLVGPLPEEISHLKGLTTIGLAGNSLSGTLPPSFSTLLGLDFFHVCCNKIHGPVPNEYGALSDMSFLSLWDNELTGTVPASLGNLTNLTVLSLSGNNLYGTIPESFANLDKLVQLFLYDNHLHGTIPESLANLDNLDELYLYGNNITGNGQFLCDRNTEFSKLELDCDKIECNCTTECH